MQMLKLTELTLLLNLVSCAKGGPWTIDVQSGFKVTKGTDLTIPCNFTHPSDQRVMEVYWKTIGTSDCSKNDNDKQAFVFHPNESCVLPNYKDKTTMTGDATKGNCDLVISNIQESRKIYLRVSTDKDKYSFYKNPVSIQLHGTDIKPDIPKSVSQGTDPSEVMTSTLEMITSSTPSSLQNDNTYLAVCIPVVALLIIIIIGIIIFIRYKRSHKVTRKESGYYVNFSRATSNAPQREASCKKVDVEPPEEKVIDEPIYINLEAPTVEMSQSAKHTDSIYANMDYSASEMI